MLQGLTRKVTLAAIVFLALIILVATAMLVSIDAMQESTTQLKDEVLPQIDSKGDFTTSMTRLAGELEAYVLKRDTEDLDGAQEALVEARDAVRRLGAEATDGDESVDPGDIAANQRILERETVMLETAQRLVGDASAPQASLGSETIAAIDALHVDMRALEDESDALLERQRANVTGAVASSVQGVFIAAGALAVLCIALVLLALFLLRRHVVQPVTTLADAADQVADGQLDRSVPVTNGDEIGVLQRAFNSMVATLGQQTQRLQQEVEAANTARRAAETAQAEIAAQLQTIEEQRVVIREMSVPVLPLSDRALVTPLIGALDTQRLVTIQEHALRAIERSGARYLLLDVTGVPLIDTQVARGLLEVAQSARLLGAVVVLVGMRPEVAQTVVGLGIRFDHLVARPTLQEGMTYVFGQR